MPDRCPLCDPKDWPNRTAEGQAHLYALEALADRAASAEGYAFQSASSHGQTGDTKNSVRNAASRAWESRYTQWGAGIPKPIPITTPEGSDGCREARGLVERISHAEDYLWGVEVEMVIAETQKEQGEAYEFARSAAKRWLAWRTGQEADDVDA